MQVQDLCRVAVAVGRVFVYFVVPGVVVGALIIFPMWINQFIYDDSIWINHFIFYTFYSKIPH
jgi:hypothetical protein